MKWFSILGGLLKSGFENKSRGVVFVALILLVFASGWLTKCAYADTRLAIATDVVHAPGTVGAFLDHRPVESVNIIGGYFDGDRGASAMFAAELLSPEVIGCRAGVGPAYLQHVNAVNGTRLNFSLSLYCCEWKGGGVVVRHISHGADFGIAPDRPNPGWNFVGIALRI